MWYFYFVAAFLFVHQILNNFYNRMCIENLIISNTNKTKLKMLRFHCKYM